MTGRIDGHHHLWDLQAVHYPWLMESAPRFFGDPAPIRRDYLLPEFRAEAAAHGIAGSVHIQVGAADPWAEAVWVDAVARNNPDWPLVQVAFCDLSAPDAADRLDRLQTLASLRGVRQIVGRAPGEDAATGTNALLDDPAFLAGLQGLAGRGLSFDLQLTPELMHRTAAVLALAPETPVALCHAGSPHDRTPDGLAAWADGLRALAALPQWCASCRGWACSTTAGRPTASARSSRPVSMPSGQIGASSAPTSRWTACRPTMPRWSPPTRRWSRARRRRRFSAARRGRSIALIDVPRRGPARVASICGGLMHVNSR